MDPPLKKLVLAVCAVWLGTSLVPVKLHNKPLLEEQTDLLDEEIDFTLVEEQPTPRALNFKLSVCLNDVYLEHKMAVATMVIDAKGDYVESAAKMLRSAKRHSKIPFSSLLLELKEKPIVDFRRRQLEQAGWVVCTVHRLAPAKAGGMMSNRFIDQFTKILLWNFVELDTLVYLDADAFVIGDITELLTSRLPASKKIGAARDHHGTWLERFNMGVFVLHPNSLDFEFLMSYQNGSRVVEYNVEWSEQGFLNALWGDEWHDIGSRYNTFSLLVGTPYWKENIARNQISVIHYTIPKPWQSNYQQPDAALKACDYWFAETAPKRLTRCLNPAIVEEKVSVWSMLEGSSDVDYAVKMLTSVRRHSKVPFTGVMMDLKGSPLEKVEVDKLQEAGWVICTVEGSSRPKANSQYAKFQLWGMTELDTAVFLDVQSYVVADISELLTGKILPENKNLGAVLDSNENMFSTDLLVIRPREKDYQLLKSYQNGKQESDQVILNTLWGSQWHNVGSRFSSNVVLADSEPALWKAGLEDARVLHYPLSVPQDCSKVSPAINEACSWRRDEIVPNIKPTKLSGCINAPSVDHKISIWSVLEDTVGKEKGAVIAAVKLLESARRNSRIAFSPVMLELESEPIVPEGRGMLEAAGWKICTVQRPRQKAKLEMWRMAELNTILFLSPRAYVLKDITNLLTIRLPETAKVGALKVMGKKWKRGFGSDVLLLHPSPTDFKALQSLEGNDNSVLMSVWFYKWLDLGFLNGGSTRLAEKARWWARKRHAIRIVLYENVKPWQCDNQSKFITEACSWWK